MNVIPDGMIPQGKNPYDCDGFVAGLDAHFRGHVYALVDVAGPDGYYFGGWILCSTDNGFTWTKTARLQDRRMTSLAVDALGHLFVGAVPGGVFFSSDFGLSWKSTGLGTDVYSLALSPTGTIFAGSPEGVWRSQVSEIIASASAGQAVVPGSFALYQNYPNPFNPTSSIRYQLPQKSAVRLAVYDLLGQKVATLVTEEKEAGHHEVNFDASGLASGVYVYRLEAGPFVQSRKLLLLR